MKSFLKRSSNYTYTQKIIQSLTFLGLWVFCFMIVIQIWITQNHEIMSLSKKIVVISAIFFDTILILISLIFLIYIVINKKDTDRIETDKMVSIIGFIFMFGALWFLQYRSRKLEILVPIFFIGMILELYSKYIHYRK